MSIANAGPGSVLRDVVRRVQRRLRAAALLRGLAAGLFAALLLVAVLWLFRGSADAWLWTSAAILAALGAAAGMFAAARMRHAHGAPSVLEAAVPASRNTILTATELLDAGDGDERIRRAVIADGAALVAGVDARSVVPLRRNVLEVGAVLVAWTLLTAVATTDPDALPSLLSAGPESTGIVAIEVSITPPAWIGGSARRLVDPERVEALAGSRIDVLVRASAQSVQLERAAGSMSMSSTDTGSFTATFVVDGDDFLSFDATRPGGEQVARRIISLRALADAAPQVRIITPGRDMILPSGDSVITVHVEAVDDHALTSLALRYTVVTGFGEQFTFTDGEVPLEIERTGVDRWQARARWPLRGLNLGRGEMVVYRAVARDRRPGAAAGESETYMIEIGDANVAAAGGYSTDEDPDRYALSQQMIIVLTERLLARRASLAAPEFAAEAQVLAAAQRRVRAEYVFMLGGELGGEHDEEEHDMSELHEEAHARADLDVLEGRIASQGRQELVRAIQSMSHAARMLNDGDVDAALRAEQTALIFLQRAFSRSRYILRALTERERIDLDRRLTGSLAGVVAQRRPQRDEPMDSTTLALRRAVSGAAHLVAHGITTEDAGAGAARLARSLIASNHLAGTVAVAAAAAQLADAANAFAAARHEEGRAAVLEAMQALTQELRQRMRPVGAAEPSTLRQLEGSLLDALRQSR